jgi:hypothetical protein
LARVSRDRAPRRTSKSSIVVGSSQDVRDWILWAACRCGRWWRRGCRRHGRRYLPAHEASRLLPPGSLAREPPWRHPGLFTAHRWVKHAFMRRSNSRACGFCTAEQSVPSFSARNMLVLFLISFSRRRCRKYACLEGLVTRAEHLSTNLSAF